MDYETIQVTPLSSSLGARIEGVDLRESLSDDQFDEIHRAFLEHLVVVLPSQPITAEQQKDFAGRFGTSLPHPVRAKLLGQTEPLALVENDEDKPPQQDQSWHTDYSFHTEIPDIAVLRSDIIPPRGGDTLWANMYAAFEALSKPMQGFLEGLEGLHAVSRKFVFEYRRMLGDEVADGIDEHFPGAVHPVVATHPLTGRKMLFVNPGYTTNIIGLAPKESDALLAFLYKHMDSPSFHVRHRWEHNDVVVWDERCTVHQGPNDFYPHHRRLYRVTAGSRAPRR